MRLRVAMSCMLFTRVTSTLYLHMLNNENLGPYMDDESVLSLACWVWSHFRLASSCLVEGLHATDPKS